MNLLRRALYYQSATWTACGLAIAIAPRWALVSVFRQIPYPDYTYVRVCGAMSIGLSLLMVLIAQNIESTWWWSWAFALTDAAIATITALHALFGLPARSSGVLWWVFAGASLALGTGLLAGLAKTGQEKPFS